MDHPDLTSLSGIYCIRCSNTEKVYVGHTTKSFRERWNQHRKELSKNRHHCFDLQNAWNQYGESSFSYHVLDVLFTKEECLEFEQAYFNGGSKDTLFNTVVSNGFVTYSSKTVPKVQRPKEKSSIIRKANEKRKDRVRKVPKNKNVVTPTTLRDNAVIDRAVERTKPQKVREVVIPPYLSRIQKKELKKEQDTKTVEPTLEPTKQIQPKSETVVYSMIDMWP